MCCSGRQRWHTNQVTGIILTGLLDDGTSGMWAIRRSGGNCIVQDPNEAEYPDMPLSVLNRMEVDHCISLMDMGTVLEEIIKTHPSKEADAPPEVKAEAQIAEKMTTGINEVSKLGKQSLYTCPDCGGGLWLVENGKLNRYRCFTGHSYTERDLELKQAESVDATLWVALRMMEERKNLLQKMEQQTRERGFARFANEHKQKAEELEKHISKMKDILRITQIDDET